MQKHRANLPLLRSLGLLKKDRFYRLLAAKCGHIDERTVREFYLALFLLVDEELNANKFVRLPFFGDFHFIIRPRVISWVTKDTRKDIGPHEELRFTAAAQWREHLKNRKKLQ